LGYDLMDRLWPIPVISDAEIYTYRMVALWAGPELGFDESLINPFDPSENFSTVSQCSLVQRKNLQKEFHTSAQLISGIW